ncbi:cation:dicarboxylate symporter family transporter [Methylobacterium longum]|uniref:Cation:dicarboxylase symporter family transporter n=1 Tax=Methylobacterium longum TaxID=767694 RepID=A0ABT8AXU4_9HYPH|nr:cation:dicarboxylase symporter family transporter [Methylobacterium longum]MDN3574316.1 cation:dicarboxylase symporter family transporter [Methylobacterium longum]GJE13352.1 Aerobic C4-dicarboxylate transport protein [Methylobacterium longum]
MRLLRSIYGQVLLGIALGIAVGVVAPDFAVGCKILGDMFINLIKMIVAPVIFCTVVVGIAHVGDMKSVGRMGLKTILYFEAATTVALGAGLLFVNLLRPGDGVNATVDSLDAKLVAGIAGKAHAQSPMEIVANIIPHSAVDAFAKGDLIQVMFFSVLVGMGLAMLGRRGEFPLKVVHAFGDVLMKVVGLIMHFAPIGAFGAMAFTIGKFGLGILAQYGMLIVSLYLTFIVFIAVFLGGVMRFYVGLSLWKLFRYSREELFILLGTTSTESVLPRIMAKLNGLGVDKSVTGLVMPAGLSFNMDGSCIYLTMAIGFIAQALNIPLTWEQELGILAIALVTSKGVAGVAGAILFVLAATLQASQLLPVAGIALIIGVDRILNELRCVTNAIGNMVATLVIARWEGKIDLAHARAVLDGRITPDFDLLDDEDAVADAIPAREPAAAFRRPLPAAVPAT